MTNPVTSAGAKLYIGGTGALVSESSWVQIGEVIDGGEFGPQYTLITYTSLSQRRKRKLKGSYDPGKIQAMMARIPADTGQAALITARGSDLNYNFKYELNDAAGTSGSIPTTMTFSAKVMGYTTKIGNVDSVVQATVDIDIDSDVTEVAAH
jgi:hypothetical protein